MELGRDLKVVVEAKPRPQVASSSVLIPSDHSRLARRVRGRAKFTEADIRTLRGVIAALENRPTRPRKRADGTETTSREADD